MLALQLGVLNLGLALGAGLASGLLLKCGTLKTFLGTKFFRHMRGICSEQDKEGGNKHIGDQFLHLAMYRRSDMIFHLLFLHEVCMLRIF